MIIKGKDSGDSAASKEITGVQQTSFEYGGRPLQDYRQIGIYPY